jgi:hypothetical protein
MIPAVDISKYQGAWQDYPASIVIIKMSGGDAGLYFDPDAATNYADAKAAGKHVGGYHFIGWTMGAIQEATWFLKAMSPLAENDVFALDVEAIPNKVDPVPYVQEMVSYIHSQINVYPLIYMNLATLNAYNWESVLQNCGLWLADWAVAPQDTIPTKYTYVMQQYSDGPNYDHDEWFNSNVGSFDAYGYHEAPAAPVPTTSTTTTTATTLTTTSSTSSSSTTTTLPPEQEPGPIINDPVLPIPQPRPKPVVVTTPSESFTSRLWDILLKILYRRHV